MRLFRPPFVGFKIFIADFIMAHSICQSKKNIGMTWDIVSTFVYDLAPTRQILSAQFALDVGDTREVAGRVTTHERIVSRDCYGSRIVF